MRTNDEFKQDVVSKIDDEIIERASATRRKLIGKPKMSYKKRMMAMALIAATFIIMITGALIAIFPLTQVPVYEGMTVSESNPMLGRGNGNLPALDSGASVINNGNGNGNNGDNGNHYGHYKGDHVKGDDDLDHEKPFGDNNTIEDAIDSDISAEAAQDMYYADPNEDVFVTVHIDNPSGYEILSFTLNGEKYSSYMFEYGSDLENLILKVNVGDVEGIQEYTIDQIKYVDGTDIKDVKMEGDKTVKIGVYTDKQPTVTVEDFAATLNSLSFKAVVSDELELVRKSNGKIQALLFDGETIVAIKEITEDGQTIVFDGLKQNTLYQYGILITYDNLSGEGTETSLCSVSAAYTCNPLLFDDVQINKTGISFKYSWYSEIKERTLLSVSLMKNGAKIRDLESDDLSIDGLLSNNEYTLIAEYKVDGGSEKIELNFTTQAKNTPEYILDEVVKTQTSFRFDIVKIDADEISTLTKMEILHGEEVLSVADSFDVREFTNLLSNNTYTVRLTYVYDLNDGRGVQTAQSYYDIKTEAKPTPQISFINAINTSVSFSFDIDVINPDDTLEIKSIGFYKGNEKIAESDLTEGITFEIAEKMTEYVVRVVYEYDLNDGVGVQTAEATRSTWAISEGLEVVDGKIVGTGSCTDSILFVNLPIADDAFRNNESIEGIYLLEGAETVGWESFYQCTNLKYVYFGEGVKTIGVSAFWGCKKLEEVYISSTVETLGDASFAHCTKLSRVTFADNSKLLDIGSATFGECTSLKTISIPDSVTSIKANAFGQSGLESIIFGENSQLNEIGEHAFANCKNLEYFEFPKNVTVVQYGAFSGCISLRAVALHDGITNIKGEAFSNCTALKSVYISDSVRDIGENAFRECEDLTIFTSHSEVSANWDENMNPLNRPIIFNARKNEYSFVTNGGSSVDSITDYFVKESPDSTKDGFFLIGWYDNEELSGNPVEFPYYSEEKTTLYAKWFDLEGNSISEGFEMDEGYIDGDYREYIAGKGACNDKVLYITQPIGPEAFEGNNTIEKIYLLSGAEFVGAEAFRECLKLKYVYIGEGVKTVSYDAFIGCANLEEVYISSTVEDLGDSSFARCAKLSSVTFADNSKLLNIGNYAFGECTSLKTISIPDSVITIEGNAFNRSGLNTVVFGENSKVNSIGEYAFCECTSLEYFEFPKNVTVVSEEMFVGCSSLKTVTLHNGITVIKQNAFRGCNSLNIIVIPDSVDIIGENAFAGCNNLTIMTTLSELPSDWSEQMNPQNRPIIFNARKNEYSFVTNGGSAVDGAIDYFIEKAPVSTNEGYILVGWYDNEGLTGEPIEFPYYSEEKTTLYAKWINEYSFVTNGGSPVENGKKAIIVEAPETTRDGFYLIGWYDNEELIGSPVEFPYYNEEKTTLYAKWFDLEGNSISEGFEMGEGYIDGYEGEYIIGLGTCNDRVLYITHPVGIGIFKDNYTVEEIYFLNGATVIGGEAFKGCTNLKYVYFGEGVKRINANAFSQCVNLESVHFSASVEKIDYAAFKGCEKLSQVTFDENIKLNSIGEWAFNLCTSLESITIPDSVTKIDKHAFQDSGLVSVIFGENTNLNIIGESAFAQCQNLETIKIPETVVTINQSAFLNCYTLTSIFIPASVETIGRDVFSWCINLIIYTDATEMPSGWSANMNPENRPIVFNVNEIIENTYSFVTNGGSSIDDLRALVVGELPVSVRDGFLLIGWYDNEELMGSPVEFPYSSEEKTTLYAKWLDIANFTDSEGLLIDSNIICGIGTCQDRILCIDKSVNSYALYGRNDAINSVTTVIFGEGVTTIAERAFSNCDSLVNVVFITETIPEIDATAFNVTYNNTNFKIYVPKEAYDHYESFAAEWWQDVIVNANKLVAY